MNTTTIHFVQDNQISTGQTNSYSWSSSVDNMSIPIQQIHYVEQPNLTLFSNNSSTKLIQMNNLETTSSINQTHSPNLIANLLPNEEMTYLTPLINVTLSEPSVNKLLPISIEPINSMDYSNQQMNNYDHCNNSTNLLNNSTLPSMAASFGSPIVVQQPTCDQNLNHKNINSNNIRTNSSNKQVKNKSMSKMNDWTKPGRRSTKLSEQKMKYPNQYSSVNLSKINKKSKQRKQNISINLNNQTKINLSNAPNNLCNLNSIYSLNLNNSNNSIDSSNSFNSLSSITSNNTLIDSKTNLEINNGDLLKSTRKKMKQNFSDQPESVKRRNLRERQRVKQLNNGYQRLRSKLPNSSKKMSKVQTLRGAANYIRLLSQILANDQIQSDQSIKYLNNKNTCVTEFKNQVDTCKTDLHLDKLNKYQASSEPNGQLIEPINYYNLDNRF